MEQNNFGTRKRLLEYDDVMNSQREVIYTKRRNALYGDKLELDINNMLADVCQELVETYQEQKNYTEFKFEALRILAYEPSIDENDFYNGKADDVSDKLFDELIHHYKQKSALIAQDAFPIVKEMYESRGSQIDNIGVPFTDGMRTMQIAVNLKKAYENQGKEIIKTFEKNSSLWIIDDEWKEHLREMDELKQSSQNAVFEQKDPLLIYKLESFNLFKDMLSRVNKDVLGMLFRGFIPIQNADEVKEARQPLRQQQPKLQTSRTDDIAEAQMAAQRMAANAGAGEHKQQQIINSVKIGRNDPCPCGSGKKYKQCHGKDEV